MAPTSEELKKEIAFLKAENAELKKNSQLNAYKTFLETSPDIILQVDALYTIVAVNIPGWPAEKLKLYIGLNVFEVESIPMAHKMRDMLVDVFKTGESYVYEVEGEVAGDYRFYLNHISAIKNEQGTVESAYFVCREITQQRTASLKVVESEKKLKALFDGSSQIIALFDCDNNFIWFNKAAYDDSIYIFGRYIAVGDCFSNYLPETNRKDYLIKFNSVLAGKTISYFREYTYHGETIFLEILLQPVYQDGVLIGVSLIGNNETERKEYESKLEKANNELLQQNEQLNQYSYIISHNLRAPIVTLMGLIHLFNQEHTNDIERNEIVSLIAKSANHLDTIIKDLNHLLTVNDHKSVMTEVDLKEEFETVQFLLENEIQQSKANIEFDFSELPIVFSLKSYIHNILFNLLSNALKYCQYGKPPRVFIKSYDTHENMVCIEIKDEGIGIDMVKHKDKIFGFYKRFHFHVDGKGLGLHLIKKHVDALGGNIELVSEVGKGSTFKIILPKESI
jgi:PAS domain S-box-containing protein